MSYMEWVAAILGMIMIVLTIRRRCLDCGKVSVPTGMGSHLRATGHRGYEELS